jgi:diguanylate cyclase (GGDEF)-like protein
MKAMFTAMFPRWIAPQPPRLPANASAQERQHWAISCAVDQYKEYRDIYGDEAAQDLLDWIYTTLSRSCRSNDRVFRRDRDGFAMILTGETLDRVKACAERHRMAVEDLQVVHQGSPSGAVTISLGIAALLPRGPAVNDGFDDADEALRRAQRTGRNKVATSLGLVAALGRA